MFELLKLFSYELPYRFKVSKGCKLVGLPTNELLLNEVAEYIFKTSKQSGERFFDYDLDFKYYYHDFKERGIDLLKDDISWWEFDTCLEAILLKGKSAIGKVLEFRTYKKPSKIDKYNREEVNYYEKKKREYKLPQTELYNEKNIGGLWAYVEKKAGEKK